MVSIWIILEYVRTLHMLRQGVVIRTIPLWNESLC